MVRSNDFPRGLPGKCVHQQWSATDYGCAAVAVIRKCPKIGEHPDNEGERNMRSNAFSISLKNVEFIAVLLVQAIPIKQVQMSLFPVSVTT